MAEVAPCCMACNVGPRCDECGCSLLVGYRPARDWALGAYLADERHGERSSAFAEASEMAALSDGQHLRQRLSSRCSGYV